MKLVSALLTTSLQVLGHVGIVLLTIELGVIVLHVVEPFRCKMKMMVIPVQTVTTTKAPKL